MKITPEQKKSLRLCVADHGPSASSVICKAWNTGNWSSVTQRASHPALHKMKSIGVSGLLAAIKAI